MIEREQLNQNIINQLENSSLVGRNLKAFENFKAKGLPHKKLEDYKYTNVNAFFPESLKLKDVGTSKTFNELNAQIEGLTPQLIIHNGKLLTSENVPKGVLVSETLEANFIEDISDDSLEDLNLTLCEKAISIKVDKETSIDQPLIILHYSDSPESIHATQVVIECGRGSKLQILEFFSSPNEGVFNRNHITHIYAEENSNVEHIKAVVEGAQSFHFGSVRGVVQKSACLHSFTYTTGAKLSRNNISVELVGIEARGEVNGLYALQDDQHCDNFSQIHHRVERTESEQLFKAVLDGVSHGIFTGKVVVHRDAQLVDSNQLNKNLLLSKKAHADTRPQLEVYADDVKCAHGATVGQLSQEELFYLESRAISPKDAKIMLCHGFVQEAMDKIKQVEIRNFLSNLLYKEYEENIHERIREEM